MPLIWWCESNELWREVTGHEEGVYCPRCFDVMAKEKGIHLLWFATENWRTGQGESNM